MKQREKVFCRSVQTSAAREQGANLCRIALSGHVVRFEIVREISILPSSIPLVIAMSRDWTVSLGNNDVLVIPIGLKMFSLKILSRSWPVTRSMRTPAQFKPGL